MADPTFNPNAPFFSGSVIEGGYPSVPTFNDSKPQGGVSLTVPPDVKEAANAEAINRDELERYGGGGAGSLNEPIPQLHKDTPKIPMGKSYSSWVTATEQSLVTPGGIEADIVKFNSDVVEVTLDSEYYQSSQPFITEFRMKFAESVDEITVSTQDKSAMGPFRPTDIVADTKELVASYSPLAKVDNLDDGTPNHFLGLKLKRYMNGVGEFTLTLFDPKWDDVEKKLVKSKGHFQFSYGNFASDRPAAKSPIYDAKALNYKADFGQEGTTLTITGLTTGYKLSFAKSSTALNLKGEIISDIVKDICDKFGDDYIPIIEPTVPVKSRDTIGSTDELNRFFNLTGESYIKVIINHLAKYAVNAEGQGNYGFFIRVNKEGKKEFHFHTMNYDPKGSNTPAAVGTTGAVLPSAVSYSQISGAAPVTTTFAKIPGFTKFRSKNSPLISFSPSWSMSVVQLTGGGGTTSSIIDMVSKQISVENVDMDTNPQKFDGKGQIITMKAKDYLPKALQSDDVLNSFKVINTPARNANQNEAIVKADFSRNYPGGVRATLEIVGSPNFYLTQKIAVFVFKPQMNNMLASLSNVHWISGFYRIVGIVDTVSAGKFTTTFELISDGRSLVTLDKVKVLK